MDETGIGWIAAIFIGGVAGWLAEIFMKTNMGVLMNIILGIVGGGYRQLSVRLVRNKPWQWMARLSHRRVHWRLHSHRDRTSCTTTGITIG